MSDLVDKKLDHVWIFLEVFAQEGGIQSYVKDILQAYSYLNYRGEIFLLRDEPKKNNPFANELITYHYLKTLPPWQGRLKLIWLLFWCLIKRRPNHVFCGHIKLALLIKIICQILNIPYTILTYGKEIWTELSAQEIDALNQATNIWTISRYTRDRSCEINHLKGDKFKILPCVVDSKIFTSGAKSPQLIEKYGLENARILLTVTRLWSSDRYKGVDITIQALPLILEKFPDVKYLIIGRGDDQTYLAQLAKKMQVEKHVIFAGFVPSEELVAHYRLADIYVMPSQEGFGIVYLEALACGIPVISGLNDGSAEPLQDGKLGWRVPHGEVTAVAKACEEILSGVDQRCNPKWLREETLTHFSKEALQKKLQLLLAEIDLH